MPDLSDLPPAAPTPPFDSAPANPTLTPESGPERLLLHMPVDVRSVSLAILATIASLWALHVASAVFIPLLLGVTLSYALSPIVDGMARYHIPRALGAALLIVGIGATAGWTAYALRDDASALIASLPEATQKVRKAVLQAKKGQAESTLNKVQQAATQLEQATQGRDAMRPPVARGVTRVTIEPQRFNLQDYLWSGTLGMVESIGQGVVVVFIAFFLLASGDSFRRKMVRIAGPTFAQKRITVQVLDEITAQIRRYMLVQVCVSVLVGVVTWLALLAIGLEHAAVWGVAAFALNFIPYIGSIILMAGSALVAFVQFGSVNMAVLVAGISLLVHTISGNLLTPWLTSQTSRVNAVSVFVGVLAFGWLWGAWGLLLGVPILTTLKAVCDRVDDLKPVGELLGT